MEPNQNPYQNQQQYQQPNQQYQQQYQQPGGGQYGGNGTVLSNRPVEFIRSQAMSAAYLVATIAFSLQIVFEIISANGIMGTILNYIGDFGYFMDTDEYLAFNQLLNIFGGGFSLGTIVTHAPAILIAVGLWMLFASAVSASLPPLSTTGLKIINVIVTIYLVCWCLFFALMVIGIIAIASEFIDYIGAGYFVLILLVVAAYFVIQILFYIKIRQTIKSGMIMAEYDQTGDPISLYVPVFCFIFAGLSIFSIVTALLSTICKMTYLITFGILLLSLRKKAEQLQYGQAVPVSAKALVNGQGGYNPPQPDPQWQDYPTQTEPDWQESPATTIQQEEWQRQQEEMRRQQEEWQRQQAEQQRRQQEEWQRQQEEMRRQQEEWQRQPRQIPNPVDPSVMGTVVLNEGQSTAPGTVVLAEEGIPTAKLVRQRDQSVVMVSKRQFRIGSDGSNVDYCISDNRSISRHHADILYQNGAFYIIDRNSTNHVALNGQRINSGQPYALQSGMRIRLANEDFLWQQG